jgi:hypothetical protein
MNAILLKMALLDNYPVVCRETLVPNIATLKSLRRTIQEAFALDDKGTIEYEVLGCRAPGHHARLRDLVVSGITRFRYLQNGARAQRIEIVIVLPPHTNLEHVIVENTERPNRSSR